MTVKLMQLLCSVLDRAVSYKLQPLTASVEDLLLTLTKEFAVDLGSCLHWGKPTGLVCGH